MEPEYSLADQPARFAKAKADNNRRVLDIDSVYDGTYLKDLAVLVTGANRGIGLALTKELLSQGARVVASVRKPGDELSAMVGPDVPLEIHTGIDVTQESATAKLAANLSGPLDIVINNAGYFYEPLETLKNLNFTEELRMIDICALGPLRVTAALYNAGQIKAPGGKVAMITSQGGSIAWRTTQNPKGGDYGHHMSKTAANMMSVLLSQELKQDGISVSVLHPGFNKTDMTSKYESIWEEEGAVDVGIGARRILHEIGRQSLATTGQFINCEDGLQIPW
ncbi:MAG: SDR family NAD(P)-dependent oxidoreductase [Cyanobacteria bacterium J06632_3]